MAIESITEIDFDDVSFTKVTPAVDCDTCVIQCTTPGTDIFIFPSNSGSQSGNAAFDRVASGDKKIWTRQRNGARLTTNTILGYIQALSGAGAQKFTMVCK